MKHEHFFLHSFDNLVQARVSIGDFIHLYNTRRLHQSLGYKTPAEVYYGAEVKEENKLKIEGYPPDGYVDNAASPFSTYPQAQQPQPLINIGV